MADCGSHPAFPGRVRVACAESGGMFEKELWVGALCGSVGSCVNEVFVSRKDAKEYRREFDLIVKSENVEL